MLEKRVGANQQKTSGSKHAAQPRRRVAPPDLRLGDLRTAHGIVFQALEVANLALNRVVNVEEIVKALSNKDIEELREAYVKDIDQSITAILGLLTKRGVVFSPGKLGKRRYYGAVTVLAPSSPLPDNKSRRQRVLNLVRGAVATLKRAVLIGDVLDYAVGKAEARDISPELISHDILGLVPTKDIIIVGTIRGDSRGANLYLPSDLLPELYMPREPLTWLELVASVFNEIWAERTKIASEMNCRPQPITTGEVRARLSSLPNPHPNLDDPRLVVNALRQLAHTDSPLIRNVKEEGQRSARWVPLATLDEEIDLDNTYASDFERVSEAVDRAVRRLGRPITVDDIQVEIDRDTSLRPAGKSGLARAVSEAAKMTIGDKGAPRRPRVTRRVFSAGSVKDTTYYYNDSETLRYAKAFINLRRLELKWSESGIKEDLGGTKSCSLSTVAVGRAMTAVAEIGHIIQRLTEEVGSDVMDKSMRDDALAFRHKVNSALSEAQEKISFYNTADPTIPAVVVLEVPGWTAAELLPIISPLYAAARNIHRTSQLIPLLEGNIRRIPNPQYENRFGADPRAAAESLYDRTDALLYMATTFGGRECRLQARLARNELGLLRDPRFIFPALCAGEFHHRLIAVSCLAFLWSEEGNKHLRHLAVEDPAQGVRQSALWAYCFANAEGGWELLRSQASNDPDESVRSFASNIVMEVNNSGSLWEV